MAGGRRGQRVPSRMDAVVDNLVQMGFKKVDIRKTVNALLKVYDNGNGRDGRDAGWIFIEESSYKLVIETLLGDQGGSEPGAPLLSDAASQENMHGDAVSSSAAGPSNAIANPDLDMLDVEKTCADGGSHQGSAVTSLEDVSFTHQDVTNNEDDVFPPGPEYTPLEITHCPPPPRPRKLSQAPPPPPETEYIPPPPPRPRKLSHAPPPPPETEYIPPPPRPRKLSNAPPPPPETKYIPPPPPRPRKLSHAPPPPPETEYIRPPPPPPPPEMEPSSPPPPRPRKLKCPPPPPPRPPPLREMEYTPPPPPLEREPTLPRVRRPCYGWWGEESEIITLPTMPVKFNGAR